MSSTGTKLFLCTETYHSLSPIISWPAFAWPSAINVIRSLSPFDVIKSKVRSTFSFSAHVLQISPKTLPVPGTQWSHAPIESLPAANAPRTNGDGKVAAAEAAAVARIVRRVSDLTAIGTSLCSSQSPGAFQTITVRRECPSPVFAVARLGEDVETPSTTSVPAQAFHV